MRRLIPLLGAALLCVAASAAAAAELTLAPDGAALSGAPLRLKVTLPEPLAGGEAEVRFELDGHQATRRLAGGEHALQLAELRPERGAATVTARLGDEVATLRLSVVAGWLSVVPPLFAIALALLFKDVLVALFLGILSGAFLLFGWNPLTALARSVDHFVWPALADSDHASILLFTTLLGGMVGVISRNGGTQGIVEWVRPYATDTRRGQLATWLMGLLVFFDDYANTLIVGPTMRPVTDRLRISREKLAYIVDCTAAPVASVVPISTWIGFEVGLIGDAFREIGLTLDPYATFVASIPYRFYPLFALVLVFALAFFRRDFGPMLRAERRAAAGRVLADDAVPLANFSSPALEPPPEAPRRARNAFLPILAVVAVTLGGLFVTGAASLERGDQGSTLEWLRAVFSHADSYSALLWASLAGLLTALALALVGRILSLRQGMDAAVEGFKSMTLALAVLLLAWSIGAVCGEMHTADFLVGLSEGVLSPHWLPVLVFLLSAATSFATGTSWGTMAILIPLVVPISHSLSLAGAHDVGSPAYQVFLLGTISSVLAGSVWGDHCSPISDTTILSSMASGCDHIAHVRTQLPYALAIGVLGMLVGDIPTAFGLSPWVSVVVGVAVIVAGVRWLGKEVGPVRSGQRGAAA